MCIDNTNKYIDVDEWYKKGKNKPSISLTRVESKLRTVVRPSMHQCPGFWVANGSAVVYYTRKYGNLNPLASCNTNGLYCALE